MTQASRLVHYIRQHRAVRQRWPTYGDLLMQGISVCPWKRLEESAHRWLRKGEVIERDRNAQGLVVFKIVRRRV
jgi:hypothetical protein